MELIFSPWETSLQLTNPFWLMKAESWVDSVISTTVWEPSNWWRKICIYGEIIIILNFNNIHFLTRVILCLWWESLLWWATFSWIVYIHIYPFYILSLSKPRNLKFLRKDLNKDNFVNKWIGILCNRSLLQLSIIIIYSKRGFNSCVMINNS